MNSWSRTADSNNDYAGSDVLTVTDAVYVEAKIGVTPNSEREHIRLYNKGPKKLFFGFVADITKMEPVLKGQGVNIPVQNNLTVYLISESGNIEVIIHELG